MFNLKLLFNLILLSFAAENSILNKHEFVQLNSTTHFAELVIHNVVHIW